MRSCSPRKGIIRFEQVEVGQAFFCPYGILHIKTATAKAVCRVDNELLIFAFNEDEKVRLLHPLLAHAA